MAARSKQKQVGNEFLKDLAEERTIDGMRIVRTGAGCYNCDSTSEPGITYAVDVSSYGGLGSCTCDDFVRRRIKRWRTIRKKFDIFRCKHLRKIRNHMLDQIIEHFAKTNKQKP